MTERPFSPAKRGDLVVCYAQRKYSAIHMLDQGVYEIVKMGEVVNITREGVVKRVRFPDGTHWTRRDWYNVQTLPKDKSIDFVALRLAYPNKYEYRSLQEAKDFIQAFVYPEAGHKENVA